MPGRDGTGPLFLGPGTGWGRGRCRVNKGIEPVEPVNPQWLGRGRGGYGVQMRRYESIPQMTKEERAALLNQRLEVIEQAMTRIKAQLADLNTE